MTRSGSIRGGSTHFQSAPPLAPRHASGARSHRDAGHVARECAEWSPTRTQLGGGFTIRAETQVTSAPVVISHRADEIISNVIAILREHFCMPADQLVSAMDLSDDLGLDSLDLMRALIDMEELFVTSFPDDAAARFRTVADIANFVAVARP
jgi:acyl carrier protein